MSKENKTSLFKRLFIALPVPRKYREHLYEKIMPLGMKLQAADSTIKTVPAENLHITLKFLGSINIEKIEKIKKAASLTAGNSKKFYYTAGDSLDAFPSLKAARVVFVPVVQGNACMEKLFSLLEDNLGKIKIRKEKRKFLGHITVARLKNMRDITERAAAVSTKYPEPLLCSHIALYESILKPSGAEYNIIEDFKLEK